MCVIGLGICSDSVPGPLHNQWQHFESMVLDNLNRQSLAELVGGMRRKRGELAQEFKAQNMMGMPQD